MDKIQEDEMPALPWQEISEVLESFLRCREEHRVETFFRRAPLKRLVLKTDLEINPETSSNSHWAKRKGMVVEVVALSIAAHAKIVGWEAEVNKDSDNCLLTLFKDDPKALDKFIAACEELSHASTEVQQAFARMNSREFQKNYSVITNFAEQRMPATTRMRDTVANPDYDGPLTDPIKRKI